MEGSYTLKSRVQSSNDFICLPRNIKCVTLCDLYNTNMYYMYNYSTCTCMCCVQVSVLTCERDQLSASEASVREEGRALREQLAALQEDSQANIIQLMQKVDDKSKAGTYMYIVCVL